MTDPEIQKETMREIEEKILRWKSVIGFW